MLCKSSVVSNRLGIQTSLLRHALALVALAVLVSSAFAQTIRPGPDQKVAGSLRYDDGDIFVGFHATDRTLDYLVNIFQPNQFATVSRGLTFQVNTGNLLADLVTIFGSDWYTRLDPNTGTNAVL